MSIALWVIVIASGAGSRNCKLVNSIVEASTPLWASEGIRRKFWLHYFSSVLKSLGITHSRVWRSKPQHRIRGREATHLAQCLFTFSLNLSCGAIPTCSICSCSAALSELCDERRNSWWSGADCRNIIRGVKRDRVQIDEQKKQVKRLRIEDVQIGIYNQSTM